MRLNMDAMKGFMGQRPGDFEFNAVSSPNRGIARAAGVLYLIMIACGMAAQAIRGGLIVPGNGLATAGNIVASGPLFRVAFLADLAMATAFLLFAWALYVLLGPVNKNTALLFVLLATASVPILSLNLLNQFAIIILLGNPGYLAAFGAAQLNAMVMLFADMHYYGYYIAQVSFGLWLFPLGYLVVKSGILPKILGVFLIVAGIGHLSGFLAAFLLPGCESLVDLVAALEIPFGLWLLAMGVKGRSQAAGSGPEAEVG